MAWDTIAASEVDANSPLNQTLFDKIRQNLNDLACSVICFSGDAEVSEGVMNSWETVKSGMVYVPDFANALSVQVETCFTKENPVNPKGRVRVSNGSGGWNTSEEFVPGNNDTYNWNEVDLPSSGSFSGAGGWRNYEIRMKQDEAIDRIAKARNIVLRVKTIV